MEKRLIKRGETSGRTDDNIESIKKRFKTFVETSMPVVEMFEKSDKVVRVECDQPVDDVYAEVVKALKVRLHSHFSTFDMLTNTGSWCCPVSFSSRILEIHVIIPVVMDPSVGD